MANQVFFNKTQLYVVGGSATVSLAITIGDGQVGGSNIIWQGETVAQGEVEGLEVSGAEGGLTGQLLLCTTMVRDINAATNHTSVTYALAGGSTDQSFTYSIDVAEPGGMAIYAITFVFI
jgi:hypothetical protein